MLVQTRHAGALCCLPTDRFSTLQALRLINLLPVALYMAFAIYLLFYTVCVLRAIELPSSNSRVIILRMLFFVGVYFVAFSVSVLTLAWSIISEQTLPDNLSYLTAFQTIGAGFWNLYDLTRVLLCLLASLNRVVWASSPAFGREFFSNFSCCNAKAKARERSSVQGKGKIHSSEGSHDSSDSGSAAPKTKMTTIQQDPDDPDEASSAFAKINFGSVESANSINTRPAPAESLPSVGIAANSGDYYVAINGDEG